VVVPAAALLQHILSTDLVPHLLRIDQQSVEIEDDRLQRSGSSTVVRRTTGTSQIVGCVYETHVRERLRVVANLPAGDRVVLLRYETEIAAKAE
jgi:hypothetical protein